LPGPPRALARAIAPVEAEEFVAGYWEQRPLVVGRAQPGRYDDLLSEADVERLVCSSGLRYPAFRLVKAGEQIQLKDYTVDIPWRPSPFTGTADAERVAAAFAEGATIVLQGLHHHWRALALFSRALESELGHPVQANAYYTPRDSQGLAVHHDTHDVFVLQVAGRKRWLVYEPALELPLKDQRYSKALGEPGQPIHDAALEPVDTLYLPRGWLHQALTSDTDSLHLTIGVNVYTWIDAFRAALESLADDIELRRSVPEDGEGAEMLLDHLADRLDPEQVTRRRRARFVKTRRPILDGQLSQLAALRSLTAETEIERRPTVVADLEVDGDAVSLAYEGKRVVFPSQVRGAVEFVATAEEPFRVDDVPGLDDQGRAVLVRRLVREGFLRLTGVPWPDESRRSDRGGEAPPPRT
jgi:ribosomal protein L16 Arg81 hydroxylase